MKTYTFIIGSTDDFDFIESLGDYVEQEGFDGDLNYSIFEFDCPAECSEEIVTMMGRGYAFSNGWCLDDTFSCVIEGSVVDEAEQAAIQAGIDARESSKNDVQNHDLWEM